MPEPQSTFLPSASRNRVMWTGGQILGPSGFYYLIWLKEVSLSKTIRKLWGHLFNLRHNRFLPPSHPMDAGKGEYLRPTLMEIRQHPWITMAAPEGPNLLGALVMESKNENQSLITSSCSVSDIFELC